MYNFLTRRNSELLEAFKMLDADGDGKVSLNDLQTVLTKISYCGQIEDGTLKTLLKRAEKTKSGFITFDKFHVLWNYLSKGEDDMRRAFNKLDQNRDGYITKEELTSYLTNSGLHPNESEQKAAKCFKSLDLNGDGKISYPEFVMGWKFHC